MPRWKPDARGRLERAALELFAEEGYEATTVAAVAERAGLTTRTFFNHFADKPEVVFQGHGALRRAIEVAVRDAPEDQAHLAVMATALRAGAAVHESDRDLVRLRHTIIVAHPALREREQLKRADVADALTDALRGRGADGRTARLLGAVGVAVFAVAYDEWIAEPAPDGHFGLLVEEALTLLSATGGPEL